LKSFFNKGLYEIQNEYPHDFLKYNGSWISYCAYTFAIAKSRMCHGVWPVYIHYRNDFNHFCNVYSLNEVQMEFYTREFICR
jgi:hypothetical protein